MNTFDGESRASSKPYDSGLLDVGDGHRLYYEQVGRNDKMPVVFLHGGPGSGCSSAHRRLLDPNLFRAVLFDQRGCGRSLPRGALDRNTSDELIADIERLRVHLGIERWLVFGGSWGGGLAIAYAAAHRASCLGLVLRGVFLGRRSDIDWFFWHARQLLPDAWAVLASAAPQQAHEDLLSWLHAGLHADASPHALDRAQRWSDWESALTQRKALRPASQPLVQTHLSASQPANASDSVLIDKYRVQSHYLINGCFWNEFGLLQRARSLSTSLSTTALPTTILHGRLDWICRPQASWELHQCLPGSRLEWVDDCGHSPFEAGMTQALTRALVTHATGEPT